MTPSELFKAGKLQEAIDGQNKEVQSKPGDHSRRLFLFELLTFAGDLDRASKQMDVISYDEMELDVAVLTYRKLLDAERSRRLLFNSGVAPSFLTSAPPAHVGLRLEAVTAFRENRLETATELLDKAADATPSLTGELNGKPFETLRDCDDLFGTVLEVMAKGAYYWVPLEEVESVTMKPPQFPRDLIWCPVQLELRSGSVAGVFVPALYPGSHEHADNQVKLGRTTDWSTSEDAPVRGLGLRTFWVNEDAVPLPEWRELRVHEPQVSP